MQRTGASRFAQRRIQRHRRLAPVADLCVGALLLQVRKMVPYGGYKLLFPNTIRVNYSTGWVYTKLAENADKVRDAKSIGKAIIHRGEPKRYKKQAWPGAIHFIKRAAQLVRLEKEFPLSDWTAPQLTRLREILEPIAVGLWPDRFQEKTPEVVNPPGAALTGATERGFIE